MLARIVRRTAAVGVAAAGAYALIVRPRQLHYGATCEETRRPLPGDELIPDARLTATRAISISARRCDVWPWLLQLGQDRGGFYTYDSLENLFGLQIHSADRIVPEWQRLEVGDYVRADRRGGWRVMEVDPGRALTLQAANPETGEVASPADLPLGTFSWAFVLEEEGEEATRLIVRARYGFQGLAPALFVEPIELADFVMTRGMLHGIKERAERTSATIAPAPCEGTAA